MMLVLDPDEAPMRVSAPMPARVRYDLVHAYLSVILEAYGAHAAGLHALGTDLTNAADRVRRGQKFTPAEMAIIACRIADARRS